MHSYIPEHVCSKLITFEIDDDLTVHHVAFTQGCTGNALGIAALAEGLPAQEIITRLKGIRCGKKNTSCPDQLACALAKALKSH